MANVFPKIKTDFRIKLGYGAAFVLLLLSYILTWYANKELIQESKWVIRSNTLINHIEALGSYMKDAETGVRGYIITDDKSFLDPYEKSRNHVDSMFDLLKTEIRSNTSEQITLYTLKGLINRKYDMLDSALVTYQQHPFILTDTIVGGPRYMLKGKIIMDSIRSEVSTMKIGEQQIFLATDDNLHSRYMAMNVIIVTSLVLAFLFGGLGLLTYLRENKARRIADEKVTEYQLQLQGRIEALDLANKELIEMRSRDKFAATGRFARTIAHEVRNPLTNIDLAVSQLKSELNELDEGAVMLFDMINRNSKRINQLITELLNATRFTDLNYEKVSVNKLLDESLELAKDRITLNHITIEKNYHSVGDVMVDKEKIKIAFLNIIVNAVEVMDGGGGLLKVDTRDENDKCVVTITDNGPGLDTATKDRLFEPYFTTKPKGNGLGLTNTQNIILNHKATIKAESEQGKGTSFIIRF